MFIWLLLRMSVVIWRPRTGGIPVLAMWGWTGRFLPCPFSEVEGEQVVTTYCGTLKMGNVFVNSVHTTIPLTMIGSVDQTRALAA